MNGKTLSMLAMAVICGLGAMYGTSRLISKEPAQPAEETQDVLVAKQDLKLEEVIKPDLVEVVRVPKSKADAGSFASTKDVEDRWVTIRILAGEQVVEKKLAPRGSPPGLVARIPDGMRAFAIEVNEQSGVSGFVLPDHRVDVVQVDQNHNGQPHAETVLQDVLVLASGQVMTRPDDKSIQARTVTLAVTPEQVDILVAAKARGTLTLSLRGLNDHLITEAKKPEPEPMPPPPPAPEPEPEVEVAAAPPPALLPPPPPPERFITIYRGLNNVQRVRMDQPNEALGGGPALASANVPPPPSPAPPD